MPIGLLGQAEPELKAVREGALIVPVRLAGPIFATIKFVLELVKILLRGKSVRLFQAVPGGSLV